MEVLEMPVLEVEEENLMQIEEDIDLAALRVWREGCRPDIVTDKSSEA